MTEVQPPRVLISNDDGPPGKESPYVFGLYMILTREFGWDVKVVLPSSQKSWIGKAYQIKDVIHGVYYYPKAPDGLGATSDVSRPLEEGEVGEWILLDGTPATCTNIALHNLYPGEIDLVITGPNFGRNTSSAFSLSSGTIGAALSSALSLVRSIAVSYGTFHHPTPKEYTEPANRLAARICKKLWEQWGKDPQGKRNGEVDLYNVNLPMIEEVAQEGSLEVVWASIWKNNYGSLFKPRVLNGQGTIASRIREAGPDAPPPTPPQSTSALAPSTSVTGSSTPVSSESTPSTPLIFQFSPRIDNLVNPPIETLPVGTDAWAIHHKKACITPLRAAFAEPGVSSMKLDGEDAPDGELSAGRAFKL